MRLSIRLAASESECVMQRSGVRPSVCLSVGILIVTHQGTACDAASVNFDLTVRKADMLVK